MTAINPFHIGQYDFEVPEELVAQTPLPQRDQSKLLVRQLDGEIKHRKFFELDQILPPGTLLILNNTKVIPARLFAETSSGANVEIFLLEQQNDRFLWSCLARPLKRLKVGSKLKFDSNVEAKVESRVEDAALDYAIIDFNVSGTDFIQWLEKSGKMPLPPYIKRTYDDSQPETSSEDIKRYQTVFAQHRGSVAAPTAALHFTDQIFNQLREKNIEIQFVCLHVGAGTFLPIKTDDIREHRMHAERYSVPEETWQSICKAKSQGRPVVCVGTTSFRSVESFFTLSHNEQVFSLNRQLSTSLYIRPESEDPSYTPRVADGLITNFHQPKSTLFLLICSLIGKSAALKIYSQAIEEKYRFFSYGDSSLLWLKK